MPRIVPIQLLKCLKVLLDDNGGILSAGEVKRLASLMTKYSKKLVSKCIYVQILKCTQTELLGEFMGAGGWSLVYTWLNDAIRAMNWPLVQEILELLLLCPVDVNRLKINSAPKLVKGLCKDGGNEGVRILAKRLVEQWLKVVTENPEATLPTSNMAPQATAVKTPTVAVVAPEAISVNIQQQQQTSAVKLTNHTSASNPQQKQQQQLEQKQEEQKITDQQKLKSNKKTNKVQEFEQEEEAEEEEDEEEEEEEENSKDNEPVDQDPLGGVDPEPVVTNYTLTPAQKKASESGLVYKFIIKDGQSILAKVPPKSNKHIPSPQPQSSVEEQDEEEAESNEVVDDDVDPDDETETPNITADNLTVETEANENSSSLDKTEKDNDSNSGSEDKIKMEDTKKNRIEDKKFLEDKEKLNSKKDHQSPKEKERRGSSSSVDKEKDKEKDSKSSKSSSSSSSHRSSSHKTPSSSSKNSSSSSSKSKSSSSSHRSSTDKHRSDKERSSSSKDKNKDRSSSSSSSSSKHKSSSSSSSKSSSSSSSSKDKYKDKEKTSSSSSKSKDKQEQSQTEKDKDTFEKVTASSSLDKLSKISKKSKEELGVGNDITESSTKSTSITIPSKKASMSIEIRKDTEKAKTVKTYKSQFRSHGLTEEAPPPPSRKGLKKPSSVTPPGTVLPSSLPSSLKRTSSPPRDSLSEKKAKIDINNVSVGNEKPGSIKLIPPKKIQTLVETNLFSDALSAATGPKKVTKRKRPNTALVNGKESPASPISPDASKVMPLKFYQDTLDESKTDDSKSNKDSDEALATKTPEENITTDDKDVEDDDDIPLKKVKEDIEQKVAKEKKLEGGNADANIIDITKDGEEEQQKDENGSSPSRQQQLGSPKGDDEVELVVEKKPGPGCGPNGPPGVLMLHRRKGPKKKLSWCPQDTLEQIRYFELDETERCNVTKTSFMDMKNMERFNERDAIVMARRGFNHEDNMETQTPWKPLIEVDDVPPHPEGNQSKQRKIQAERELTTLRALYFSHALIPDSPAEAEFEPAFNHDVPLIPLDDLTGNPDAVNDFTSMPWPEPRGSPKQGDNSMSGTGGLGSPVNMFGNSSTQVINAPNNNKQGNASQFNPFVNPFAGKQGSNGSNGPPIHNSPQNQWQGPGSSMIGPMGNNGPMMGNPFNGGHGSPLMDIGGPGPMGPGPMMNNGPPQNFMNQFSPNFGGPPNPFMGGPSGFNNGPINFGPMGPGSPMVNGIGPGPMGNNCPPQMMNGGHINRNNRNNGGNWRSGGSNFQDNSGGGGNWRPAGPGPNIRGGGGGNINNGVCKAFMRGHCRLGNSCKYIHPNKSKRI